MAGFVDALGFLIFAHIYTANMSGNSVALGIALNQRQWAMCMFRFWPILLYFIGLMFGRTLLEIGAKRRTRRIASIAFACEAVLLAIAVFVNQPAGSSPGSGWQYTGVALLSLAMGIQNAALTKFSSLTIHTGFVTGTLVNAAERLVAFGTDVIDAVRSSKSLPQAILLSARGKAFRFGIFLVFVWLAYILGAVAGTWGKVLVESKALIAPIAGLLLLIAIDVIRPLAVQEEREQAQLT